MILVSIISPGCFSEPEVETSESFELQFSVNNSNNSSWEIWFPIPIIVGPNIEPEPSLISLRIADSRDEFSIANWNGSDLLRVSGENDTNVSVEITIDSDYYEPNYLGWSLIWEWGDFETEWNETIFLPVNGTPELQVKASWYHYYSGYLGCGPAVTHLNTTDISPNYGTPDIWFELMVGMNRVEVVYLPAGCND